MRHDNTRIQYALKFDNARNLWRLEDNQRVKCLASCMTSEAAHDICDTYAHAYPDQDYEVEEVMPNA